MKYTFPFATELNTQVHLQYPHLLKIIACSSTRTPTSNRRISRIEIITQIKVSYKFFFCKQSIQVQASRIEMP